MKPSQPTPKVKSYPLGNLPGFPQEVQDQLAKINITHTHELLKHCRSLEEINAIALQAQLTPKTLQKWVIMANLSRIPSVGCRYCGLLLHCGIISPTQLAQTPFPRLHQTIVRLHVSTMQRKDISPSLQKVKQWVLEAKQFSC